MTTVVYGSYTRGGIWFGLTFIMFVIPIFRTAQDSDIEPIVPGFS